MHSSSISPPLGQEAAGQAAAADDGHKHQQGHQANHNSNKLNDAFSSVLHVLIIPGIIDIIVIFAIIIFIPPGKIKAILRIFCTAFPA